MVKEEVLVLDNKKFRNLKRKLKSIEKEEQKQVKILRNIEQGRFLLNGQGRFLPNEQGRFLPNE